jgi:hypothetical protein
MTYTQADIETLRARSENFAERWSRAEAGEMFGSPGDYEAFMGQWRENSRRLTVAEAQASA